MSRQAACVVGLLMALVLPGPASAQRTAKVYDDRIEIRVLNDWDARVTVAILAERNEEIVRTTWDFAPGESAFLGSDDRRIRVRGSDRIKVRDGFKGVLISDVAQFREGHWFARVRDVYWAQRDRDEEAGPARKVPYSGEGVGPVEKTAYAAQVEPGMDRPGFDYDRIELRAPDPALCLDRCRDDRRCRAYTYVRPGVQGRYALCYLKDRVPRATDNDCCTSGVLRGD